MRSAQTVIIGQRGIRCEQMNDRMWRQLHDAPEIDAANAKRRARCCSARPASCGRGGVRRSCSLKSAARPAQVRSAEAVSSARDRGEDGHCADGKVTAVFLERNIECVTVSRLSVDIMTNGDAPRASAGVSSLRSIRSVVRRSRRTAAFSGKKFQHPCRRDRLREHGGDCRAAHTPVRARK